MAHQVHPSYRRKYSRVGDLGSDLACSRTGSPVAGLFAVRILAQCLRALQKALVDDTQIGVSSVGRLAVLDVDGDVRACTLLACRAIRSMGWIVAGELRGRVEGSRGCRSRGTMWKGAYVDYKEVSSGWRRCTWQGLHDADLFSESFDAINVDKVRG